MMETLLKRRYYLYYMKFSYFKHYKHPVMENKRISPALGLYKREITKTSLTTRISS